MDRGKDYHIHSARSPEDIEATRRLFSAYKDFLGIDLTFQDYDEEFATLPGKYSPPAGELLLARDPDGMAIACVRLHPLDAERCCEVKRLFVTPAGRGTGVGKALVEAIINTAHGLGYREMRLDTLTSMTQAISIYRKCGFIPMEAYYHNPIRDSQFMQLHL